MRELIGKNTELVSTSRAPANENLRRPRGLSYLSPQGTTADGAETQSRLNAGLTSAGGGERTSSVVVENVNDNKEVERKIGVETTEQELEGEGDNQYDDDCNPEFPEIEKQF